MKRADLKSDFRISLGDGLTKTFADTQAVRTARSDVDREMADIVSIVSHSEEASMQEHREHHALKARERRLSVICYRLDAKVEWNRNFGWKANFLQCFR